MTEPCIIPMDSIIQIISITTAIIAIIYEILASRSRDTRVSSPLQMALTGTGKLIYKLTDKKAFGRFNKIEPNSREQLLNDLQVSAHNLDADLWVERIKRDESFQKSLRKKPINFKLDID